VINAIRIVSVILKIVILRPEVVMLTSLLEVHVLKISIAQSVLTVILNLDSVKQFLKKDPHVLLKQTANYLELVDLEDFAGTQLALIYILSLLVQTYLTLKTTILAHSASQAMHLKEFMEIK